MQIMKAKSNPRSHTHSLTVLFGDIVDRRDDNPRLRSQNWNDNRQHEPS